MMAFKSLAVAGALALSTIFAVSAAPTPAEAKTKVVIGVGVNTGCWNYPYYACGYRRYPRLYAPRYRPFLYEPGYYGYYNAYPRVVVTGRYGCSAAKSVLRDRGFRKIVVNDCSGTYYSFRARKNGKVYRVKFNAVNGVITSVARI